MLIFDCETDGLLDELTTIHCLHMGDPDTDEQWRYSDLHVHTKAPDGTIEDGLKRLEEADEIGAHNGHRFDMRAIKKIYPWFNPKGYVWCTQAIAALVFPKDQLKTDDAKTKGGKRKFPDEFYAKNYFATQKLGAWGYRMGILKGEYEGEWHTFTAEMDDYCAQDVTVTMALWKLCQSKKMSDQSFWLENEVARIIAGQEANGFAFRTERAEELAHELRMRKAELDGQLRKVFKPWWAKDGGAKTAMLSYKRTMRRKKVFPDGTVGKEETTAGENVATKVALVMFNPGSRQHIANRMKTLYGWVPQELTPSGEPKIDEEALDGMDAPEAVLLKEYLMVDKRLSMLADGKQAWLKHVAEDGRIHGYVNTNLAITGRMSHAFPNIAQVPKVKSDKNGPIKGTAGGYGYECRDLFTVREGYKLVGCDADGLELRNMAHFMARYDDGAYANTVVNGDKSKGTDVHTMNQKAGGLFSRDGAKTAIYALIYGSGDYNLGFVIVSDWPEEKRKAWMAKRPSEQARARGYTQLGKQFRTDIMKNLPALKKLNDAVALRVKQQGWITGIDGRKLPIRKSFAALNSLLQSAGALVMKMALVLLEKSIIEAGYTIGKEVAFAANVHDEFQIEAREDIAEEIGKLAEDAIFRAGEEFNFRCPLSGSSDIGTTWAETH